MESDQISATDIGPGPIILSRRRISLPWRRNQPHQMWHLTKYPQQLSGLPQSPSGIDHLHRQTSRLLPNFPTDAAAARTISNQRHISLTYDQPMPGISNPALRLLRGRLRYWLTAFLRHASWKHWPFESSKYCLAYLLYLCGTHTLLRSNKRHGCFYLFYVCTPIKP